MADARPRKSPRRKSGSWSKLAPATRKRYQGAGITRQDYYKGVDLRAARGHKPRPAPTAAPAAITERVIGGEGTMADLDALPRWLVITETATKSGRKVQNLVDAAGQSPDAF